MEREKNTSSQDNTWLKRLDEQLKKLGSKQGDSLKGKTGIYIPKQKNIITSNPDSTDRQKLQKK